MISYDFFKKNFKFFYFIFFVIFGILLFLQIVSLDAHKLEVNFLDIGQGDAAYIKFPNGNNLIIDTGPNKFTINKIDEQKGLLDKGISNILLTHPDGDHIGGTKEIIDKHKIQNVFLAKFLAYDLAFEGEQYYLMAGDRIQFGEYVLNVLNPKAFDNTETNHNSLVTSLDYGAISFLFMGDADKEAERQILSGGKVNYLKERVLVLKVGHHGSNTSSSENFLKTLAPEYCVISVGKDNRYGHPTAEVLALLGKYCGEVLRTDMLGTIQFDTDGESLQIDHK